MGRRPLPKRINPLVMSPLTLIAIWGISSPFELLSPTSGQVTNALLTRSPLGHLRTNTKGLVRLACIRHAASVHPEPGSNSPQKTGHVRRHVVFLLTAMLIKSTRLKTFYHFSIVKVLVERARFYHLASGCQGLLASKTPGPVVASTPGVLPPTMNAWSRSSCVVQLLGIFPCGCVIRSVDRMMIIWSLGQKVKAFVKTGAD